MAGPAERMALRLAAENVPLAAAASELASFSRDNLAAARDSLVDYLQSQPGDLAAAFALAALYRAIAVHD